MSNKDQACTSEFVLVWGFLRVGLLFLIFFQMHSPVHRSKNLIPK